MATLRVEIVSPEAVLWRGEASALVARSRDGDFTILAQHTPMVGELVPHAVRVDSPEGSVVFAVHGGFFRVGPGPEPGETLVSVLAPVAEPVSEIDVARAQAARERALADVAAAGEDEFARLDAERALERAELRLGLVGA